MIVILESIESAITAPNSAMPRFSSVEFEDSRIIPFCSLLMRITVDTSVHMVGAVTVRVNVEVEVWETYRRI